MTTGTDFGPVLNPTNTQQCHGRVKRIDITTQWIREAIRNISNGRLQYIFQAVNYVADEFTCRGTKMKIQSKRIKHIFCFHLEDKCFPWLQKKIIVDWILIFSKEAPFD